MLERNQRIIFNPFPMKRRIKYVATTVGQIDKKDENILQVFQLSCILLFSDLHGSHSGVSGNGFLTLRYMMIVCNGMSCISHSCSSPELKELLSELSRKFRGVSCPELSFINHDVATSQGCHIGYSKLNDVPI